VVEEKLEKIADPFLRVKWTSICMRCSENNLELEQSAKKLDQID